jgi:hypothetical protein
MADNTLINPGVDGDLIASNELTTINGAAAPALLKVQRVKVGHGVPGDFNDATDEDPLPVSVQAELLETMSALRAIIQSLSRSIGLITVDVTGQQRVTAAVTSLPTLASVTTVTTVSTVTTMANQTNIGSYAANDQIPALMHLSADNLRRNITVS